MTRAEDLLKALDALQAAAGSELSGEAHSAAKQHIRALFQLAGFDGEDTGEAGSESTITFAEAIAEVRTQAEGELSGHSFYIASKALDDLAALSSGQPREAAFDELSAASKTRVEGVAANLGMEMAHQQASPLHDHHEAHDYDDPLAGVELEKRSSEPCSMPEIEPIAVHGGTAIEAVSAREVAEATHDFGIPAIEAGPLPDYAQPGRVTVQNRPEPAAAAPKAEAPAVAAAAPAKEASSAPAAKKIETKPREHPKEEQKSFFSLWLDMVFGRRK